MRANTLPRATLAALGIVAVLAGPASAGDPDTRGTVFVTERQLGSVTAFDGATGSPLWTARTGTAPIGVTLPHGTHKVYTSDEGSNQMSVLDARTGASLGKIPMGPLPTTCSPAQTAAGSTSASSARTRLGSWTPSTT